MIFQCIHIDKTTVIITRIKHKEKNNYNVCSTHIFYKSIFMMPQDASDQVHAFGTTRSG